eukprot:m.264674 g.264674  ORF g.264674 m.264674 type:complete len:308 (-) comp57525_c0_seq1:75-998(-)
MDAFDIHHDKVDLNMQVETHSTNTDVITTTTAVAELNFAALTVETEHVRSAMDPTTRPKCSICINTKKNSASYLCTVCGPLCRGCDATRHDSPPPALLSHTILHEPPSFLIIHHISKKSNGWGVVRSAVAFGIRMVIVVGSDKMNAFGCKGSDRYMEFKHFSRLEHAHHYVKDELSADVVGIEICDEAKPLSTAPFKGATAFLMGNEGQGLSEKEMNICDWFVYIPQHGQGTASLNVTIATSIVLYQFATWAKYAEAPRKGYKFVEAPRPDRINKKNRAVAVAAPPLNAAEGNSIGELIVEASIFDK